MELEIFKIVVVLASAFLIGFSKTGLPNMIIFVITLLMLAFPAKESIGILLPLLLIGDGFALTYHRRNVVWRHLIVLLPWVLVGMVIGYFTLLYVTNEQLKPIIGVIVLLMICVHFILNFLGQDMQRILPSSAWFVSSMGVLAGFTTMVGNAAGGVMTVYFLVRGLPKNELIGTGVWFYLSVNLIKFPFYLQLGIINKDILLLSFMLIPIIFIGAFVGIRLLRIIPQRLFQRLILLFATIGGIYLLF